MKKIPSVYARNFDTDKLLRDEVNPGCEWVFNGEGVATRKYDGTAILIRGGKPYKRFDAKNGKTPPLDFVPCEASPDPNTGHWPGWIPAPREKSENRWLGEALDWWEKIHFAPPPDWTYELCGPKINGNPELIEPHTLVKHGGFALDAPRTFFGLAGFLASANIEGIVWWRNLDDPDCDKAKIKTKDLGLPRGVLSRHYQVIG